MSDRFDKSRRRFVKLGAIGIVSTPLIGRVALAQDRVEEDDPTAQSLNYRHDASEVEHAQYQEGRYCFNCQLYQGGEDDEWAACPIFANKLVAGQGWCTAWVAKS